MRKITGRMLAVLVCILIQLNLTMPAAFAADEPEQSGYSTSDIIIVYDDSASKAEKKEVLEENNLEKVETINSSENSIVASTDSETSVEEAVKKAEKSDAVLYAQPNYKYRLLKTTNDPKLSQQTYLNEYQTNVSSTGISAWDYSTGKGVNIAIIDSGLNTSLTDVKGHLKGTYNAVTGGTDVTESSAELAQSKGHGTHVTGIAAAIGDNGVCGAGVAYDANIYFAKVFGIDEEGDYCCYTSDMVKAYDWAVSKKCRIINMSIGGYAYDEYDKLLSDRISNNYRKSTDSVLTVCAGGNDGTDKKSYPSDYPDSYSVSAVQYDSNNSPVYTIYSDHNSYKDIAAPGGASGSPMYSLDYNSDTTLKGMKGTSMAAPFVSGVAALMLQVNPELSAKELTDIFRQTATAVTGTDKKDGYGYGLINPLAALKYASYSVTGIKTTYTPLANENLSFKAVSRRDGNIFDFKITDSQGNRVRSLGSATLAKGSSQTFNWNFTDSNGEVVPSGKYTINGVVTNSGYSQGTFTKTVTVKIADKPVLSGYSVTSSVERNDFNSAKIKFRLNTKTLMDTTILDSEGNEVRSFRGNRTGSVTESWDLKDNEGKLVPAGDYWVSTTGYNIWGTDYLVSTGADIKITTPKKVSFISYANSAKKPRATGEKVSIKFNLSQDARITIKIYSSSGKLVRTLVSNKVLKKGVHTAKWNLKNNSSKIVGPGKYTIKVTAKNSVNSVTKSGTTTLVKLAPKAKITGVKKSYRKGKTAAVNIKTNQALKIKVVIINEKGKSMKTVLKATRKVKGTYTVKYKTTKKGKFRFRVKIYNENGKKYINSSQFKVK